MELSMYIIDLLVGSSTCLVRASFRPRRSDFLLPISLQGPHQCAQKSTRTGTSASRTSFVKLCSFTGLTFPAAAAVVMPRRWLLYTRDAQPLVVSRLIGAPWRARNCAPHLELVSPIDLEETHKLPLVSLLPDAPATIRELAIAALILPGVPVWPSKPRTPPTQASRSERKKKRTNERNDTRASETETETKTETQTETETETDMMDILDMETNTETERGVVRAASQAGRMAREFDLLDVTPTSLIFLSRSQSVACPPHSYFNIKQFSCKNTHRIFLLKYESDILELYRFFYYHAPFFPGG